jgi:hypothetical protein
MKFRDHWSAEMRENWDKAPEDHRFTYRMNQWVISLLAGQLVVLWVFYLFTALSINTWNGQLTVFAIVYGFITGVIVMNMIRWRAFTLLSAVVIGEKEFFWSQGRKSYKSLRKALNPEKMGLYNAASWNRFEAALELETVEGEIAKLYIYRPFAYLNNLEGLMERILEKIPTR